MLIKFECYLFLKGLIVLLSWKKYSDFGIRPEFKCDSSTSLAVCFEAIYINLSDSDFPCVNIEDSIGTSQGCHED